MTGAQRSEFRLGGRTLAACLIGIACGASPVPYNVIGFTLDPIHAQLGWSFAEISAGVMIFGIIASLLAPVFGFLGDRYGVRPVVLASLALFGLAFAAIGLAPASLAGYYVLWGMLGLVGIGSTPVTFNRAIVMWFRRHCGLALGIALVGTSISALVVPRVAVWAIETYSWRAMYVIVAGFPLLIALPLCLLWFREPRPEEMPGEVTSATGTVHGVTLREALRDRRFWIIWASILAVALVYGGAFIHMPEIIKQHGMGMAQGANIMGVIGISMLTGRLAFGWLLDRIWAPLVGLPALLLPALAVWLLTGSNTSEPLVYFAAFLFGFAGGAESDLIAYLASRYFGPAHFGKIYGMLYMPFGIGSSFSPVIYGRVHDMTGNYDQALHFAIVGFFIGAALLLTLGRYPDFAGASHVEPEPGASPA